MVDFKKLLKSMKEPINVHVRRWENCQLCGLCKTRTKIVLGKGAYPCDVLFIGEAPGPNEDIIGAPFVGPAGGMLADMIKAAGFNVVDHDIFPLTTAYTNLIACFPVDGEGGKFKEPPKESVMACLPRVIEFVGICKPKYLVLVGAAAEKYLTKPLDDPKNGFVEIPRVTITHPGAILKVENKASKSLMIIRNIAILREVASHEVFQNEPKTRPVKKKSSKPTKKPSPRRT